MNSFLYGSILFFMILLLCFCIFMMILLTVSLFRKVPFVPSSKKYVRAMVDIANITEDDVVCDLGAGHGTILLVAEAHMPHAKAYVGYETAPLPRFLFWLRKFFRKTSVQVVNKNFFTADLSRYSVVFLYLLPETMDELLPILQKQLKKGTRIISNTFTFKNLQPQRTFTEKEYPGIKKIFEYRI